MSANAIPLRVAFAWAPNPPMALRKMQSGDLQGYANARKLT